MFPTTVTLEGSTMRTREGMRFSEETKQDYKRLLINMIYKLLPIREEGKDWELYLESCLLEIQGFHDIFEEVEELHIIRILSKLESLKYLTDEKDFYLYRKTILECTNLID